METCTIQINGRLQLWWMVWNRWQWGEVGQELFGLKQAGCKRMSAQRWWGNLEMRHSRREEFQLEKCLKEWEVS